MNKFDASGDNFVGFWFLQGQVGPTGSGNPPGSPFSGAHTVGDILVLADYTNGGDVSTFSVYKWVASGGDAHLGWLFSLSLKGLSVTPSA